MIHKKNSLSLILAAGLVQVLPLSQQMLKLHSNAVI